MAFDHDEMPSNPVAQPPTRECGECRMCCKVLSVHERTEHGKPPVYVKADDTWEFHKPSGKWCQFVGGKGCTVYEDKPRCCTEFSCLWLIGVTGEEDRPDKSKVVMTAEQTPEHGNLIIVYESYPGVLTSKRRVREWIERSLNLEAIDGVAIIPSPGSPRRLLHKTRGVEHAIPMNEQWTPEQLTVDVDALDAQTEAKREADSPSIVKENESEGTT